MIFYCDTCDEFYTDEDLEGLTDDLTDVPCPRCSMPLSGLGDGEPYDTLEEKNS